jgi:glycosyltransferase involved in cell wall biosynthesis
MKSLFRYLTTREFVGTLAEYIGIIIWTFHLRLKWKYRDALGFLQTSVVSSDALTRELHISCRNFLMPGFSGVNVWVENIARTMSRDFSITIFCQGRNLFKEQIEQRNNVTLIKIPILKFLKFRSLPLYSAWNSALSNQVENNKNINILFGPLSGVETFGLDSFVNVQVYSMLVTDERTHRFPLMDIEDLRLGFKFDPRTREILSRERAVLGAKNGRFLADSNAIVNHLELIYEFDISNRTVLLPINLPVDECNTTQKENIFFFVGRSDLRKDLTTLLNAWGLVSSLLSDWKLVVATSRGDDKLAFKRALIFSTSASESDLILDASEDLKHELYSKSRIVICPSRFESFGIVALEAMQHRCVTIASNVGGLPEVLADCGIFFDMGSELDLATKMVTLARDLKLVESLAEKSYRRASKIFSDQSVKDIISQLYKH